MKKTFFSISLLIFAQFVWASGLIAICGLRWFRKRYLLALLALFLAVNANAATVILNPTTWYQRENNSQVISEWIVEPTNLYFVSNSGKRFEPYWRYDGINLSGEIQNLTLHFEYWAYYGWHSGTGNNAADVMILDELDKFPSPVDDKIISNVQFPNTNNVRVDIIDSGTGITNNFVAALSGFTGDSFILGLSDRDFMNNNMPIAWFTPAGTYLEIEYTSEPIPEPALHGHRQYRFRQVPRPE